MLTATFVRQLVIARSESVTPLLVGGIQEKASHGQNLLDAYFKSLAEGEHGGHTTKYSVCL